MAHPPSLVVYVHFIAALTAMLVGAVQLARPKGTDSHRAIGWTWATLMMTVAITSLWIPSFLKFSWIHLFTLLTVVTLPLALFNAHRGNVRAHAGGMRGLYLGGVIIAGIFAFAPGRLLGNFLWKGVWGYLPGI